MRAVESRGGLEAVGGGVGGPVELGWAGQVWRGLRPGGSASSRVDGVWVGVDRWLWMAVDGIPGDEEGTAHNVMYNVIHPRAWKHQRDGRASGSCIFNSKKRVIYGHTHHSRAMNKALVLFALVALLFQGTHARPVTCVDALWCFVW